MKHKKVWIAGIAVLLILALAFAGYNIYRFPAMLRSLPDHSLSDSQVEEVKDEILSGSDIKVLVAYFSYSGTTKNVATALSEKTGGDLFEIAAQDGYSDVYQESNREIRNNDRPALTNTVSNMDEYDIVFVGYPVWWHATPAPINTFLESYDLTGKLIIPFCTSAESDIDETMPTFLQSCDGLAVYGERRISGTDQLDGWLSELGLSGNITGQGSEAQTGTPEPETTVSEESTEEPETPETEANGGNVLIAYFSVMETDGVDTVSGASRVVVDGESLGNNQYIAQLIQQETGGDLFAIETVQEYPTTHDPLLEFAYDEKAENARPELAAHIEDPDSYDVIFLGYPNWNADLPMPLYTFLEEYDFSGKTIIPFTTHGGSGFSGTIQTISELQPDANVISDGLAISRNNVSEAQREVIDWVNGLNLNAE